MQKIFSFLCAISTLCSVSAAALPGKSGAMKRSKDFEIYQVVETAYRKYVAELTEFQTQYTATKRFEEAKRIQEEIQKNIGYVRQIGKSYQFIFSSQTTLPKEGHVLREKRNFGVKDAVRKILNSYVAKLKTEQSVYLKSRDLPRAKVVQEEIQRMTNELKRLEGLGKALVQKIPVDAKKFNGHWYKFFNDSIPWGEAKKRCQEMGGYLACVETKGERKFLNRLAKDRVVWSGGSDNAQEGKFVWLNGKELVVKVADNNHHRDYVIIARGGGLAARHESGDFSSSFGIKKIQGFICEWE